MTQRRPLPPSAWAALCLLLFHAHVGGVTEVPPFAVKPAEDFRDFEVPDGLLHLEKTATRSGSHQLGYLELSSSAPRPIPFDESHFKYDEADWSLFEGTEAGNTMIVSAPSSPHKKLVIRMPVEASSDIVITFQIYMTSQSARQEPSFSVFLVSSGSKSLLGEEHAQNFWMSSSHHVKTDAEGELVFEGALNAHGNEIALGNFTIQHLSPEHPKRYGVTSPQASHHQVLPESPSEVTSGMAGNSSDSDSTMSESMDEAEVSSSLDEASGTDFALTTPDIPDWPDPVNATDRARTTDPDPDAEMLSPDEGHRNYTFEVSSEDIVDPDASVFGASVPSVSSPMEVALDSEGNAATPSDQLPLDPSNSTLTSPPPEAALNSTSPAGEEAPSSSAWGVFHFFVGVFALLAVALALLGWRRWRAKQDDEVPVFSRAASEHGNPTFIDDETNFDVGLNTETPSNYRSFR